MVCPGLVPVEKGVVRHFGEGGEGNIGGGETMCASWTSVCAMSSETVFIPTAMKVLPFFAAGT